MSRWRRAALGIAGLLLTAAVTAEAVFLGSLPRTKGTIAVPGLAAEATIGRDRWGVPTISASSETDLYYAVGFAHAQDRLWQMAFNRRLAQGRLAEVLGSAGLTYDRFFRTLGLAPAARSSVDGLAPEARRLLDSYAAGVNAFLATRGGPLPPEFQLLWTGMEPWRAEDSVLQLKLVAFDLAGNWRQELTRARLATVLPRDRLDELLPPSPADDPLTYRSLDSAALERLAAALPPAPDAPAASNVWVIDGARSASGAPLLANDPHLGLSMPGPWYAARLEAPGLRLAGATLPGVPFVVMGQSEHLAWGVTNPGFDLQDLFVETPDPARPGHYRTPEGARPFETRVESIGVRGAEPVRLEVRRTRHGPVLSGLGGEADTVLALAWTGLDAADRTVEAGFAVARATDAAGFRAAFAPFAHPPLNVAYADRHGTIGMMSVGRVPVRASGDGRSPADGASGRHDWRGALATSALPSLQDPPDGWLANANNRLVEDGYPHLLTNDWEPPWRMRRIEALLRTTTAADLAVMRRIQLDRRSGVWDDLRAWLLPSAPDDPEAGRWRRELLAWDGFGAPEAKEPLKFWSWLAEVGPAVWADELGPAAPMLGGLRATTLRYLHEEAQAWCDDRRTPAHESCAEISARALSLARKGLAGRLGADESGWRWDTLHVAQLAHRPLDQVPVLRRLFSRSVPVGGDSGSVNVAHVDLDEPFVSRHAASWRGLYDLADRGRARFILPGGQSGHPASRHYDDMLNAWREGSDLPLSPDMSMDGHVLRLLPD